jgi:hypothetical protein
MPMRAWTLTGAGLVLWAGQAFSQPAPSLDWPALGEKIVERLALKPGEKVLLVVQPALFQELVPYLRYAVMKAGGADLGAVEVMTSPAGSSFDPEVLQKALRPARGAFQFLLLTVDAAVMLPGTNPSHAVFGAMQDMHREGRARSIHLHWTEESAVAPPGGSRPPREVILATYQRALLGADHEAIAEAQKRFEAAMRKGEIRVTTRAGTDLRFRIGDRPVIRQDGDASAARARRAAVLSEREIEIPAGAVRVAPLEETVEGTIVLPRSEWGGRPVEQARLRFEKGKIVEVSAASGLEALDADLKRAGDLGRGLRELAVGFHPALAVPAENPWIPYFGYGAGVVRLSIGDNSDLGGRLTGGYSKTNLFIDATLIAGGESWVGEGKLSSKLQP